MVDKDKLDDPVEIVARNLAGALAELAEMAVRVERESRAARRRIVTEVRKLARSGSFGTELELSEALAAAANQYSAELGVTSSPSDAIVPVEKPAFSPTGGCLGQQGGGVKADFGGVSVSMCVTGSLDEGITGGGFEVSVTY